MWNDKRVPAHLSHLCLLLLFLLQRILHIFAYLPCISAQSVPNTRPKQHTNTDRPNPILEPLPAKHGSKDNFRILEPSGGLDTSASLFLAVLVVYCAKVWVGEDLHQDD